MNVLTNHGNGHCGMSLPESRTACHAAILVMQISAKASSSKGTPGPETQLHYTCSKALQDAHFHTCACTRSHEMQHPHLHTSMAGPVMTGL